MYAWVASLQHPDHRRRKSPCRSASWLAHARSWPNDVPWKHMNGRPGWDVTTKPRTAAGPCLPPVGHGPAPSNGSRRRERTCPKGRRGADTRTASGSVWRPGCATGRRTLSISALVPTAAELDHEAGHVAGADSNGPGLLISVRSAGRRRRRHRLDQLPGPGARQPQPGRGHSSRRSRRPTARLGIFFRPSNRHTRGVVQHRRT